MSTELKEGDIVYYYATAYPFTVKGRIIELPNRRRGVKVEILESPNPRLLAPGDEKFFPKLRLFSTREQADSFGRGYDQPLGGIRERVLENLLNLPPDLVRICYTDSYTQDPRKVLRFKFGPSDWIKYWVTLFPRRAELKLTLAVKEAKRRKLAKERLEGKETQLVKALEEGSVRFNWQPRDSKAVWEEIEWTGSIDHIVKRLTSYIKTIQPMLRDL